MNEIKEIRFIDLFAGVGGFRFGLEKANQSFRQYLSEPTRSRKHIRQGGIKSYNQGKWTETEQQEHSTQNNYFKCVFTNDFDRWATSVYNHQFKERREAVDVRKVDASVIPPHNLLCGGFPCQSFSIAGKRRGFEDTRGTLFYEICRVAEFHRPELLFLENVKGLLNHSGGRTFRTILQSLDELGYDAEWEVLNSKNFGVPQNRERVFIVGHSRERSWREIFPLGEVGEEADELQRFENDGPVGAITARRGTAQSDGDYIVEGVGEAQKMITHQFDPLGKNQRSQVNRVYKTEGLDETLRAQGADDVKIFVQPVLTPDRPEMLAWSKSTREKGRIEERVKLGEANTLSTGEGGGNASTQNYVIQSHSPRTNDPSLGGSGPLKSDKHSFTVDSTPHFVLGQRIRRLTPTECERLQGFPDGWTKLGIVSGKVVEMSDTQRYKMMGNAVTVNVIQAIGEKLLGCLDA